jgi:hypothetical protein
MHVKNYAPSHGRQIAAESILVGLSRSDRVVANNRADEFIWFDVIWNNGVSSFGESSEVTRGKEEPEGSNFQVRAAPAPHLHF